MPRLTNFLCGGWLADRVRDHHAVMLGRLSDRAGWKGDSGALLRLSHRKQHTQGGMVRHPTGKETCVVVSQTSLSLPHSGQPCIITSKMRG
jgi:hypothetical protein